MQVSHLPRAEGHSNYTLRRLVRLWLAMFLNFSVMPLRLATLLGLGVGGLGTLAAAFTIIEAVISDKAPQGWASLMVAVLVLTGVQLVVLGMIGEYLGRMFLAVNRKPQYLVREIFWRGARLASMWNGSRWTHAPRASRIEAGSRPSRGLGQTRRGRRAADNSSVVGLCGRAVEGSIATEDTPGNGSSLLYLCSTASSSVTAALYRWVPDI